MGISNSETAVLYESPLRLQISSRRLYFDDLLLNSISFVSYLTTAQTLTFETTDMYIASAPYLHSPLHILSSTEFSQVSNDVAFLSADDLIHSNYEVIPF
jgi:hypothetical protein